LTALGGLLAAGHASAATACATDLTSLNGAYATLITGGSLSKGTAKYQTGVAVFDGAGNVSGSNAYGAAGAHSSISGTYLQNADCTYTVDFTNGVLSPAAFTIALDDSGQASGIEVDASAVANIYLKPQSATPGAAVSLSSSSLNGTYALTCSGPLSGSSDVNLVTFNNGSLSGTDPYNNSGTFATSNVPYTGTYSVNSDGTFKGSLVVTGTTFFFYGAVVPATNELMYVYEDSGSGKPIDSFAGCLGATALGASGGGTTGGAFALSPSQPTLQVARGKNHSRHITVTPASGFAGTVTFSASGQPSGVTVSFSPTSSTSSTDMNIAVASSAAVGSYPITVTGTSAGIAAQTTTVTLIAK
jgi:hypothetical protein